MKIIAELVRAGLEMISPPKPDPKPVERRDVRCPGCLKVYRMAPIGIMECRCRCMFKVPPK